MTIAPLPIALLSAQHAAPLVLNGARFRLRNRRGWREFIDPAEWPARVNDSFRMRCHPTRLVLWGDARVEGGAPGLAHDVDLLRGLAARRDPPHHIIEVGGIDV